METIKTLLAAIVVLGLIFGIISIIFYIYHFVKAIFMLLKQKTEKLSVNANLNKYIYFEHYGDNGIGKIYNTAPEGDEPYYVVACIYNKTNATQHLPLNKIQKFVPIKLMEISLEEIKILNKQNKK